MMGFRRNHGLRIDTSCERTAGRQLCLIFIDRDMRKLERPSDHAPVIAEVWIPGRNGPTAIAIVPV